MESITVQRIKMLIERENETPNSFAIKVGLNPNSIYNLLNGGQPRKSTLIKIIDKYPNYTLDWLLGADAKVIDITERVELERLREEVKWLKSLVERLSGSPVPAKTASNFRKALGLAGATGKVVEMYFAGAQLGAQRA
jgi:hypothetical protein